MTQHSSVRSELYARCNVEVHVQQCMFPVRCICIMLSEVHLRCVCVCVLKYFLLTLQRDMKTSRLCCLKVCQ